MNTNKPFQFVCTIAVGRSGLPMLMSHIPNSWERVIIEGDYPDNSDWMNLPDLPGLWTCVVDVQWRNEWPVIKVLDNKLNIGAIIKKATLVKIEPTSSVGGGE